MKDGLLGRTVKIENEERVIIGCLAKNAGKVDFFIGVENTPSLANLPDGNYYALKDYPTWVTEAEVRKQIGVPKPKEK